MMHLAHALIVATLFSQPAAAQTALEIALAHDSPAEAQTKAQLQRLLATHDLSAWLFTRTIVVDERAVPHSHPVLTLHTRHDKDDELLLSTFVHEQFHWYLSNRKDATEAAMGELRKLFPLPGGTAANAAEEYSTYLHLVVCYLERQADLRLFGELKTKQIMDFWSGDHYAWVYQMVTTRPRDIGTVLRAHKLSLPQGAP